MGYRRGNIAPAPGSASIRRFHNGTYETLIVTCEQVPIATSSVPAETNGTQCHVPNPNGQTPLRARDGELSVSAGTLEPLGLRVSHSFMGSTRTLALPKPLPLRGSPVALSSARRH